MRPPGSRGLFCSGAPFWQRQKASPRQLLLLAGRWRRRSCLLFLFLRPQQTVPKLRRPGTPDFSNARSGDRPPSPPKASARKKAARRRHCNSRGFDSLYSIHLPHRRPKNEHRSSTAVSRQATCPTGCPSTGPALNIAAVSRWSPLARTDLVLGPKNKARPLAFATEFHLPRRVFSSLDTTS